MDRLGLVGAGEGSPAESVVVGDDEEDLSSVEEAASPWSWSVSATPPATTTPSSSSYSSAVSSVVVGDSESATTKLGAPACCTATRGSRTT